MGFKSRASSKRFPSQPEYRPVPRVAPGSLGIKRGRPHVATFPTQAKALALIECARSVEVPLRLWKRSDVFGAENLVRERGTQTCASLGEILDYLRDRNRPFESAEAQLDYSVWCLANLIPGLTECVQPPSDLRRPPIAQLWAGGQGHISTLHFDNTNNYNFQLYGEKQFTLFSPADIELLYPKPDGPTNEFRVNPQSPDLAAFCEFEKARGYRCTLRAGEVLFIPFGWPHQVVHCSPLAINLSFWEEFGSPKNAAAKAQR